MDLSKEDKFGRKLEAFLFHSISDSDIPELKDLQKLTAYMEVSSFDRNRIQLNKIELFNLN